MVISLLKKKKKIFLRSNALSAKAKVIILQSVLRKIFKKLVSASTTFTPVTSAIKKAFRNAETGEINENSENYKNGDEDLEINLAQVFCI